MAQASIGLSRSFESALADQGQQAVTAWEIVRSLLKDHQEYADYLGGKVVELPGPEGGVRREAQEWVAALRELYDPSLVGLIDGRLAIWGLSQLDPALGDYLKRHDFLFPLEREIQRDAGHEPHALIRRRFVEGDEGAALKSDAPNILDRRQQAALDDERESGDLSSQLTQEERRQQELDQAEEVTTITGREAEVEAPYLPPGPGYISDAVSDDAELVDHLGIEREVRTIAHVMTSKKVYPPLSLGLFGDWGSGKSFFMGKLRQHVAAIAAYYRKREREGNQEQAGEWCTRVVQIDFNAWHYSDANLWASLVTRIYEALYGELQGDEPTDAKTRRLIQEKVQQAEEEVEAATAQVDAAKERVEKAEGDLLETRQQRARQESLLSGLLGDVRSLLTTETGVDYDILKRAASNLGYPEAAESYDALVDLNNDLRNLSRRMQALLLYIARSPGTFIALFLALILYLLAEPTATFLIDGLDALQTRIVEAGALLLPLAAWLKMVVGHGIEAVNTVHDSVQKVEAARQERIESSEPVKEAQQQVAQARAEEAAAESRLANAHADLQRLQSQLDALQPERRLLHLLEERSQSGTYTRHLGLVSLIRNDFERLSQILKDLNEEERDLEKEAPPIQRIILYIDDLDRCRPEQVVEVLEAVHLLLAFPLFIVVVGVDPRWLRHSLRKQYPENLGEDGGGPGEEQATPQQYLEKIFQIPFALRPVDKDGFEEMVGTLLSPPPVEERQSSREGGTTAPDGEEGVTEPALAPESEDGGPDEPTVETAMDGQEEIAEPEGVVEAGAAEPHDEEDKIEESVRRPLLERPLNAEQLAFQSWEEKDVKRLWTMFRTPRTIKRFVNTYRLLRAGITSPAAVSRFEGSEKEPGSYQIAILLLAVVTSYPHLAGRFLLALDEWLDREEAEAAQTVDGSEDSLPIYRWADVVTALRDAQAGEEWDYLLSCLGGIAGDGTWRPFTGETLRKWALRVSRYSFALHSSQALYEQFGAPQTQQSGQ